MRIMLAISAAMLAAAGPVGAQSSAPARPAAATKALDPRTAVYELRVYYPAPGKLAEINARFRDHTTKLFIKHGMRNVAYWNEAPSEAVPEGRLIYVLAYPSREAREASWKAFRDDPEWRAVVAKTEANGKLTAKVDSTFMSMTDYSPALTLPR